MHDALGQWLLFIMLVGPVGGALLRHARELRSAPGARRGGTGGGSPDGGIGGASGGTAARGRGSAPHGGSAGTRAPSWFRERRVARLKAAGTEHAARVRDWAQQRSHERKLREHAAKTGADPDSVGRLADPVAPPSWRDASRPLRPRRWRLRRSRSRPSETPRTSGPLTGDDSPRLDDPEFRTPNRSSPLDDAPWPEPPVTVPPAGPPRREDIHVSGIRLTPETGATGPAGPTIITCTVITDAAPPKASATEPPPPRIVRGALTGRTTAVSSDRLREPAQALFDSARAGNILGKIEAVRDIAEFLGFLGGGVAAMAMQMSEPGSSYGAEITEPLKQVGRMLDAAGIRAAETEGVMQRLAGTKVGEMPGSAMQAPDRQELSEAGTR